MSIENRGPSFESKQQDTARRKHQRFVLAPVLELQLQVEDWWDAAQQQTQGSRDATGWKMCSGRILNERMQ